jgi:hypothetical protein
VGIGVGDESVEDVMAEVRRESGLGPDVQLSRGVGGAQCVARSSVPNANGTGSIIPFAHSVSCQLWMNASSFRQSTQGLPVRVTRIDLRDDHRLVAICMRGRNKQVIGLTDLPLPHPNPPGAEWIEAYRHWSGGR